MMKDCDEEDSCDHRYNFDLIGGRRAWFPRVSLGWTAPQVCLQRKRGTSPPPPPPLVYAFLSGLIWFPLLYLDFVNCPSKYKDIATKMMEMWNYLYEILRSGVLAIGLIGSTLALSGLVAYAIVQVRSKQANKSFTNIFYLVTYRSPPRCQHCAPILVNTSPTQQPKPLRKKVSGILSL